ncbi:MAG TPA: hypothetical protein PLZ94_14925 [Armatimonadota bacterium]|nr:hypothetical protein [Armatimonadota bacterium]
MDDRGRAKEYLVDRLRRDGVISGTPEALAADAGFTARAMEEALAELVAENRIQPFQDDEGNLEYQWKEYQLF